MLSWAIATQIGTFEMPPFIRLVDDDMPELPSRFHNSSDVHHDDIVPIAEMTDDERERYEAWRKSEQPEWDRQANHRSWLKNEASQLEAFLTYRKWRRRVEGPPWRNPEALDEVVRLWASWSAANPYPRRVKGGDAETHKKMVKAWTEKYRRELTAKFEDDRGWRRGDFMRALTFSQDLDAGIILDLHLPGGHERMRVNSTEDRALNAVVHHRRDRSPRHGEVGHRAVGIAQIG